MTFVGCGSKKPGMSKHTLITFTAPKISSVESAITALLHSVTGTGTGEVVGFEWVFQGAPQPFASTNTSSDVNNV